MFVWENGKPAESDLAQDRGLHYGDGLFETMIVRAGRVRFFECHLDRLFDGVARLRLSLPPRMQCASEIAAGAHKLGEGTLKLLVTRGAMQKRGYAPPLQPARRLLLAYSLGGGSPVAANVWCCELVLGEQPVTAGIKSLNRLEQVLAAAECRAAADRLETEIHEGLLCSSGGRLVSGVSGNVFWFDGRQLLTPCVDRCGVAGIMRRIVLREAATLGIAVSEQATAIDSILGAREVFMTNVRWPLLPVKQIIAPGGAERRSFAAPGEVTQLLTARIAGLDR